MDRTSQLRAILRELVNLAVAEHWPTKRRQMLERAIETTADLIAKEQPPRKRFWRRERASVLSAAIGIVAGLLSIVTYVLAW